MSRINTKAKRKQAFRETYGGKYLVFCEGGTEEAYLNYIKALKHDRYTSIQIVPRNVGGGTAKGVFDTANRWLANEQNNQKYMYFEKCLMFDCDKPENIQMIIQEMCSKKYTLFLSNSCFEVWLVMHFMDVTAASNPAKLMKRLAQSSGVDSYDKTEATIAAVLRRIDTKAIEKAIERAKENNKKNQEMGRTKMNHICEMNPYTNVHELVEPLLNAQRTTSKPYN